MAGHSSTGILNLPEQTKPSKGSFDTRPHVVEAWVAKLPMGSTGEAARQIFTALREMNRLDIPAKDRLKSLEAFSSPVQAITETLKKHFVNQNLPLSLKGQKVAELAIQLHSEMALGYKYVVAKIINARFPLPQNTLLSTSIHRAIRYLNNVLLFSYQLYSQHPEHVWLQIHRLFMLAEERKLQNTATKEQLTDGNTINNSIDDIYKQALMLALAGPYRLRQKVTEAVYNALEDWVSLCRIVPYDLHNETDFAFTISLNTDSAPGYFRTNGTSHPEFCRHVDTGALVRVIHEILGGKAEAPEGLSPDILKRLLLTWRSQVQRSFTRQAKSSQISITLGLSATHHYIDEIIYPLLEDPTQSCAAAVEPLHAKTVAENGDNHLVLDNPANYTSTPIFGISNIDDHTPDVWEPDYTYRANNPIFSFRPAEEEDSLRRRAALYAPFSCKSINESAGGYCLIGYLVNGKDSRKVQVGELVGIKDSVNPSSTELSIGVIRRIKNWSDGLELGIQKLSPCASAIATASGSNIAEPQDKFQRSLALPELSALGQPGTIITHTWHRPGDEIIVYAHGQHSHVVLTRQIENTGVYSQFEFNVIENEADPSDSHENAGQDEFDSIWNQI